MRKFFNWGEKKLIFTVNAYRYFLLEESQHSSCCCVSHSILSDSSLPQGLQPSRLLCPWDFPGKNTGVGCYFFLQGIFPTQDQTHVTCVSCTGRGFFTTVPPGKPAPTARLAHSPWEGHWSSQTRLPIVLGDPITERHPRAKPSHPVPWPLCVMILAGLVFQQWFQWPSLCESSQWEETQNHGTLGWTGPLRASSSSWLDGRRNWHPKVSHMLGQQQASGQARPESLFSTSQLLWHQQLHGPRAGQVWA